ncbi:MAG: TonB-dependent receptor [Barnesiella sp.]|nr:TonB-dependent receptor [Barnesiella sp.]
MEKLSVLTIAATIGCVPVMEAAELTSTAEDADSMSAVNLKEVAVVAQRADAKTPVAYTNVTAKEIERLNTGVDVPYLLAMTPSVVTTSDAGGGIGYTSIRVRGTDGSRINVTSNGVPVNDPESHNVYWVDLPDIASSVKDFQVQRGVGTSTNGAGAFGGSINMVTDTPSRDPYASFSGSYGMYNTHKESIKAGTGIIHDHWSVETRLSNVGTDGYIDRATSDLYSYFAQVGYYSGASSLRLLAYGGKERTYMAWDYASKEQMAEYGRRYNPCGEYTDKDGNRAYYPNQYDNYTQHNFQLLGRHRFSSSLAFDAALHYTKGDGNYEQYKTRRSLIEYGLQPFDVTTVNPDGTVTTETVKKSDLVRIKKMDNGFGGGLFNLTYSGRKVSGVVGGALNAYHGSHFGQVAWVRNYVGDIDPLQQYYRNTGHKIDGNIYARANVDLTTDLSAYIDMQYRHITYTIKGASDTYDYNIGAMGRLNIDRKFDFFNPKAGLNYTFGKYHRAFASWSVAHKEPTRNNFIDCPPGREPVAERLFDYEAGYTFVRGMLSAGVNLYYMYYKDQLVATGQLSDTGNPVSENVSSSYRAGIELQLGLKPCQWFDWNINATLSRNRIKDFVEYIYDDNDYASYITINRGSSRISFSPDFILNNEFNFTWKSFDASLRSHYVSRQYLTNSEQRDQSLDPYFVSNLMLGYTFSIEGLKSVRVGFTVNNLFSEKYENNGYAGSGYYVDEAGEKVIYSYTGYSAQAPINVIGSVTVNF